MNSTLLLEVACQSPATAKKLAAVLAPDNRSFPSDQHFSMAVRFSSVVFKVESVRVQSAFTTIHGILRDVVLFQEIWLIPRARDG